MNNAMVTVEEEQELDKVEILRIQATELNDIIEALEKITASNYWKILENKLFHGELASLKNRLSKASDTIEIYRLQGEITRAEKYDLNKMLSDNRSKLSNLKKKI